MELTSASRGRTRRRSVPNAIRWRTAITRSNGEPRDSFVN